MRIRIGKPEDVPAVVALYDGAVEWLAATGRSGQWGTEPWSGNPRHVARVQRFADSGEMRVAERGDALVGAMRLGPAPRFIPPVEEPELFLEALVIDRRCAGLGIGAALLDHARAEAAEQGIGLLRLECWAGGDQGLVRYYERAGFVQTGRIKSAIGNEDWEGAILAQRLERRAQAC
ncbi:L-amino acid N-acyltransferase YncA [Actinomadura pelletieri DSM 43383]|uniref:L-amino acid N-acyltransferase YncA n=1 Tax=Actinomadura pelletieri DSM 43383 TaxID=1120940 RepID=A0A495QHM1_9ACTN|nr:GNAT family N-acetyltransferase [Actinomadura pelletieri]RKS71647.1 L-amino acid N-acyltransferase YncA [Actinomadura pelletieri DSM 43383]